MKRSASSVRIETVGIYAIFLDEAGNEAILIAGAAEELTLADRIQARLHRK